MTVFKKIWLNYWIVIVLGAFFALTTIYNSFGSCYSIFWNTFIKTTRELLIISLLYKSIENQKNTLSIIFAIGGISVSFSYMLFRFICAFTAFNFDTYMILMADNVNRLIMSVIIFCILAAIKYVNWK